MNNKKELIGEYMKRSTNHELLLSSLKEVNHMIQKASRLRVGRFKAEVVQVFCFLVFLFFCVCVFEKKNQPNWNFSPPIEHQGKKNPEKIKKKKQKAKKRKNKKQKLKLDGQKKKWVTVYSDTKFLFFFSPLLFKWQVLFLCFLFEFLFFVVMVFFFLKGLSRCRQTQQYVFSIQNHQDWKTNIEKSKKKTKNLFFCHFCFYVWIVFSWQFYVFMGEGRQ